MVKHLSTVLGANLGKQLAYDNPQIEILVYGLEITLETVIKLILLGLLAMLFGIGIPVLIVLISYSLFRTLGGGVHLSTFPRCLTVGTLLIIGLAKLSTLPITKITFTICFIGTVLLGLLCIVMWVPADTEKKRITDPQVRNKQKQKLMVLSAIWAIAIFWLNSQGLIMYKQALIFGAFAALLFITPVGYWLMKALDNALDTILKGGAHE